jgi:hypothetical protein
MSIVQTLRQDERHALQLFLRKLMHWFNDVTVKLPVLQPNDEFHRIEHLIHYVVDSRGTFSCASFWTGGFTTTPSEQGMHNGTPLQ